MSKLFIGFAAGLLVGVLFAPDKGSETRDRLARRGRDLKDKFNDMIDSLSDKFDSLKGEANEYTQRARQKAESYTGQQSSAWSGEATM